MALVRQTKRLKIQITKLKSYRHAHPKEEGDTKNFHVGKKVSQ